jgi:hypothetical protein
MTLTNPRWFVPGRKRAKTWLVSIFYLRPFFRFQVPRLQEVDLRWIFPLTPKLNYTQWRRPTQSLVQMALAAKTCLCSTYPWMRRLAATYQILRLTPRWVLEALHLHIKKNRKLGRDLLIAWNIIHSSLWPVRIPIRRYSLIVIHDKRYR